MNLYLAFTPYHALLSYSEALSRRQSENVLFVIAEFSEARALSRALKNSSLRVFENVICLPGAGRGKSVFAKMFKRKKNVFFLKKFIAGHRVENIFVGNNSRIEAQAALYYGKKVIPDCKGIYIEDGTAVYRSEIPERKDFFIKIFYKFFFGPWWQDENILGVSPRIDVCIIVFPKFARNELKVKEIIAANKENFLRARSDKTFAEYFESLNCDVKKFNDTDILLINPYSGLIEKYPQLEEVMSAIFLNVCDKNMRLAVKYHPREYLNDFLRQERENVLILPKAIPLELLYVASPTPPKLIIGVHSTALMTARWLFPSVQIVSIAPLCGYYDRSIFEIFKKINIRLAFNIEDIWSITKNL